MNVSPGERRKIDPDYFSLRIRRALQAAEPEEYMDDPLAGAVAPDAGDLLSEEFTSLSDHPEVVAADLVVVEAEAGDLLSEEFTSLSDHPEVVAADLVVVEAEAAVMEAEDAGLTDELAMWRLDRARAAKREVLVRLQRQRAVAHTQRAVSRVAQVVPLRRFAVVEGGAAA
ncbi:hypothetical protein [Saccharopolyspora sp. NPDC050642]|uniref:hypothetical protein n=1 Tax=Saccharopolyspora sp. NPDC050642 TaxID=3157099 RepID=UPI0033FA56E2